MESLLSLLRMHWDHEPRDWSAGLRPGAVDNPGGRLAPGRRPALRFMESFLSLLRRHWDHELQLLLSRPSATLSPALGGGEGRERGLFMESLLSLLRRHWDHEPTPNPSREGNGQDADRCLFPSWEGSGVGRFMERGRVARPENSPGKKFSGRPNMAC